MAKKNLFADFSELDADFVFPGGEAQDDDAAQEAGDDIPEEEGASDEEADAPEVADDAEDDAAPEEEEAAEDKSEEGDELSFEPFLQNLYESGVLVVDEDKEYDDTEEGFAEAVEDTVQAKLAQTVQGLPETAQRLLNLALKGGTEDDLQDLLTLQDGVDWEEADLDDEDVQKAAAEEAMRLREPDLTDEEVEEKLADLEDLGKLRKQAEKDVKFLVKQVEAQKQAVEARLEQREQEATQRYEQEVKQVKDFVFSQEQIAGLPLSKKEKEGFLAYLTVKDKKGQTESDRRNTWERRIMKEYLNYLDFNVQQVERKVTTEVTQNIKKQLARYKAKGGQGGNQPVRVERESSGFAKPLMPWDLPTED